MSFGRIPARCEIKIARFGPIPVSTASSEHDAVKQFDKTEEPAQWLRAMRRGCHRIGRSGPGDAEGLDRFFALLVHALRQRAARRNAST